MLQKTIQKTAASTILAIFLSTGLLTGISEAAPQKQLPPPPPGQHQQIQKAKNMSYSRNHRPQKHKKEASATGNLVTGLIVGGVIGAVIANNT